MKSLGIPEIDESDATHIVGADEVGLGAYAGPLVVAVVYVPRDWVGPKGLTDSKKLSRLAITRISEAFYAEAAKDEANERIFWAIQWSHNDDIDKNGVGKELRWLHKTLVEAALRRCEAFAKGKPLAVVDGNMNIPGAISVPKADLLVPACSMASVLAKHARDKHMVEMDGEYPGYDFGSNVGYNAPKHTAGLDRLGPCAIHRQSFSPIAAYGRRKETPNLWDEFDSD